MRAVDRRWLVLDCDDVIVPAGLGRAERLVDAALYVREHVLPPEFRDVRMIAIPSASTGLQGDAVARLKLFVALDRAWPLETLKAWVMGARVCDALPLDPAVDPGRATRLHREAGVHRHGRSGPCVMPRGHPAGKRRRGVSGRGSVRGEGGRRSAPR